MALIMLYILICESHCDMWVINFPWKVTLIFVLNFHVVIFVESFTICLVSRKLEVKKIKKKNIGQKMEKNLYW